ncbi:MULTISPECIES: HEPN domain-containing protein [Acinetobacter]|uniref:HEPN domain-containing protein n=1 Tax=Acinetobacter TaxID=469 RepID=UPI0002AEC41E|nr:MULTISPECIES: HEPN domain-containing protein [Acinetobacter]ELW85350.1 hypothetical protein ACINWC743_0187 [Acinetobacter sp. WC-743]MBJ8426439.1 hypothetical protein [Acinetobacter bereziniae]MBJ8445971.1 hypothetical protein [Acinetobacter bereziniae]MBJ8476735.1 hypothetical protein [Acinetobacter bereziniae]
MDFKTLKLELAYVDKLVTDFDRIAPSSNLANTPIRADLAGLLLVAICAIYENLVKQIMIEHADSVHTDFSHFIEKNYKKLNSKIQRKDLCNYLKLFSPSKELVFTQEMQRYQKMMNGRHPNEKYSQLLEWRHAYAHSKNHVTTIEEAYKHHRIGKLVIYAFNKAISR